MPKQDNQDKYQAKRQADNNNNQKDTNKKIGQMASKAAANYFTGGKGGALVDKLANTKLGSAAMQKMGDSFVKKNPGIGKIANNLNKAGVLGKDDKKTANGDNSEESQSESNTQKRSTNFGKITDFFNKKNKPNILNDEGESEEQDDSSSEINVQGQGKKFIENFSKYKSIILPILPVIIIGFITTMGMAALVMASDDEGSGNVRDEESSIACSTDSKLVDVALAEVGNNEADGTHAKYLQFMGFSPNTAWCAAFVSWCADQAGIDTTAIPHTASVSSLLAYFKEANTFKAITSGYEPVTGNLIIWKAMGRSHIGIVKDYDSSKDTLTTVEGNSSNAVRVNTYKFSTLSSQGVVGFATPQQQECTDTTDGDNATTIKSGQTITLPKNLGTHATREFDLAVTSAQINYARSMMSNYRKIVNPYAFPENTLQRKVQDKWIASGAKHDSKGFCKLDGRYLVATTTTFGKIGDKVDFYMSNGTIIHVILGDAKAQQKSWYDQHPADKWGHSGGKNVLEFMGKNSIGDNPYYTLGLNGQSVVKAVNGGSIFK